MLHPKRTDEGSLVTAWREQFVHARANPFLLQLFLKQWQRILKRLAYFYAQLASMPRRNRRALQRASATSLIGAAMLLALSSAPVVHAVSMTVDGTTVADDGKCSLVEAIYNSNSDSQIFVTAGECPAGSGADIITLPSNGTFDYTNHYAPAFALPAVTTDITINANNSTISRNPGATDDFGILAVATASGSLTLNDAIVTGGIVYGPSFYLGGGITNYEGTLVLNNCTVTYNLSYVGGGVSTLLGTTTINDSDINTNFAFGGGGLAVINGTLTLDNTTVGNNLAFVAGGIANVSADLPSIASQTSNLTLTNSAVTYNIAYSDGGGIFTYGYDDPTVPIPPPKPEIGSPHAAASPKKFETFLRARGANLNLQDLKAKLGSGALKPGRASGDVQTRKPAARDKDDSPKRDGKKRAHAAPKPESINADTFAITDITFSTIDHNTAYGYGGGIATDKYTRTYITNSVITTNAADEGGGVHNYYGEVTITDSTISYNQAFGEDGGGLRNDEGTVTINRTTVTGNTSVDDGGGLNNRGYGTMFVTNSTLAGNTATYGDGGGFRNVTGAVSVLENVTIFGNHADNFGGGVALNDGEITLARTLVSGNTSTHGNEVGSTNYPGTTFNLNDYNLLGHNGETNAQAIYGPTIGASDITATSDGSNPTALASILNTTLANNSSLIATPAGIVQTLALVANSPAIDQAPNADCAAPPVNGVDQRNLTRNVDDGPPSVNDCDIGAYEFGAPTAVNVTNIRALARPDKNVLKWQTTSETQIAGFNVYRRVGKGQWKQINAKFKQAKHSGDAAGAQYRFADKKVRAGKAHRYKIEVHYLDGHTEWTPAIRAKQK